MQDIVVLTFAGAATLPFAGWVAVRMMEHIERLEMIRRGIAPPPDGPWVLRVAPLPNVLARTYLRRAIGFACAAFIAMMCLAYLAYPHP